jgi:hypothetical protein
MERTVEDIRQALEAKQQIRADEQQALEEERKIALTSRDYRRIKIQNEQQNQRAEYARMARKAQSDGRKKEQGYQDNQQQSERPVGISETERTSDEVSGTTSSATKTVIQPTNESTGENEPRTLKRSIDLTKRPIDSSEEPRNRKQKL